MKVSHSLDIKNIFFLIVLGIVAFFTFRLFQPYLNIIIFSLVIVQIFHPIYRFIYNRTKVKGVATLVSVLTAIALLVVPIILIILLILTEVRNLTLTTDLTGSLFNLENSINNTIRNLNGFFAQLNIEFTVEPVNFQVIALEGVNGIRDQLLPVAQQVLTLSGEIVFNIFLLILCMIYFFPMFENLQESFSRISPLDKKLDVIMFNKFRDTITGVIRGSFFVAIVQSTAVLIPLLFLNVGAPVLLWIIMVILSILPVGSGLVWGPIGLAIIGEGITQGNTSQILIGVFLIIYSAIIINVIDTTLRPIIMRDTVKIHPLVTIFSVLGGLYYFGPVGILYGPLVVVLFLSIMDVYNKKYSEEDLLIEPPNEDAKIS
jgi:predicted PurR-regulated permease PerM